MSSFRVVIPTGQCFQGPDRFWRVFSSDCGLVGFFFSSV